MSDTRTGADRTKRAKRQPTVGWLIGKLAAYPKDALVLVQGQGSLEGIETNVKAVEEIIPSKDSDTADYELQYVSGRRPRRKMVMIK